MSFTQPDLTTDQPRWWGVGDINAFFALMLDNIGDMILMAGLLVGVYGFPKDFVVTRMIPGTAIGVLVGDLVYTYMAVRLSRKTGRAVTAMPLGLDTPSTFGAVVLILAPAFRHATRSVAEGGLGLADEAAARHAWFVGIAMILASGLFKLACAPISGWMRRVVPRAGLLGSLVAIALVIISFLPLMDVAAQPIAGFAALAIILASLTAGWRMPRNVPGALVAVVVGCVVMGLVNLGHLGLNRLGYGPWPLLWSEGARPTVNFRAILPMPVTAWWAWFQQNMGEAASYLPVALPLALGTVVGGIDCAESATAAGDDFKTGRIIGVEGLATLAGGFFGGVIQTTPYIGHPAYKAMGARAGYTLATALFVGGAGVFGYFEWIFYLLPKAVVFPILIFIGLEITAQSFRATPRKHYPALAFACVPALAYLARVNLDQVVSPTPEGFSALPLRVQRWVQTITMLSGGFILISLLWATVLARLIDGRMSAAVRTLWLCAVFAFFGVIHSPLPSGPIALPWSVWEQLQRQGRSEASSSQTPIHWAVAYAIVALVVWVIGKRGTAPLPEGAEEPFVD